MSLVRDSLTEKISVAIKSGREGFFSRIDLLVIPVILLCSILPLLYYSRTWYIYSDDSEYLMKSLNLASGKGYTAYGRGPMLPIVLSALIKLLGTNSEAIAWTMRALALLIPLFVYFLVKRVAGPTAGLVGAALVAFFGYIALVPQAFTVDALEAVIYMFCLVTTLYALQSGLTWLSLLSGILLGLAILTKETSFTGVPFALIAALIAGGRFRVLLAHYIGLASMCLPWWIWVYVETGDIYLLESGQIHILNTLPPRFPALAFAAALALTVGIIIAYRLGLPQWYLRSERRRQLTAWTLICMWAVALSGVLLVSDFSQALPSWSDGKYLLHIVLSQTPLWFFFPLAAGFLIWQTVRGQRSYAYLLAIWICWLPLCVLLAVLHYNIRQWIIPQALFYSGIAAMAGHSLESIFNKGKVAK